MIFDAGVFVAVILRYFTRTKKVTGLTKSFQTNLKLSANNGQYPNSLVARHTTTTLDTNTPRILPNNFFIRPRNDNAVIFDQTVSRRIQSLYLMRSSIAP